MEKTTVQLTKETKKKLEQEKSSPRETYEKVVRELLTEREQRLKKEIEKAKKRGKHYSLEEIKEEFNLK
ncbi:MAG: hypothetical protein ACOCTT_00445 [archaeon]